MKGDDTSVVYARRVVRPMPHLRFCRAILTSDLSRNNVAALHAATFSHKRTKPT